MSEELTKSFEVRWDDLDLNAIAVFRGNGEEAAVVRTLGTWIDIAARRMTAPPAGLRKALEAVRAGDCELLDAVKV